MTKTSAEIRQRIASDYAALDAYKQIKALALFGARLTFLARDTYNQTEEKADNIQFRKYNESFNRIFGQLNRLLENDQLRYPDDLFANILIDQLDVLGTDSDELARVIGSN